MILASQTESALAVEYGIARSTVQRIAAHLDTIEQIRESLEVLRLCKDPRIDER